MTLAGRVSFVTGGGSGIGRAIALRFAAEGSPVVVADIDGDAARAAGQEIVRRGGRALAVAGDVADEAAVELAVMAALAEMGHIDILANVAGIWIGGSVTEISVADWDRVIAVNLRGAFLCSRAVLPQMVRRRHGVIINMASIAGMKGTRRAGAYNPSKAALILLTKNMALDYAPYGIRVNAICPGGVAGTGMDAAVTKFRGDTEEVRQFSVSVHPLGREGTPEEIAAAALYLASDDAVWITGTSLVIDGGAMTGY